MVDPRERTERLRCRDPQAFEGLIEEYARLLWVVAERYLAKSAGFSAEDIEECVSEAFFRFWQHPDRFDPDKGSLKTYLCSMTKNLAISAFRKRAGAATLPLDEALDYDAAPAPAPDDPIDYQALYDEIARLPEPSREILVRRYFYEQKPAAIAEVMGLPKKEVENRLYRAKKTLRLSLSEDQEDQR